MAETARDLEAFLARHADCALVEVVEARGSTPREAGTWMLAAQDAAFGTIGGGQLEWMAIDEARRVLARDSVDRGPSNPSRELGLRAGAIPPLRPPSAATPPPDGGSGRALGSPHLAPLRSPNRGERWLAAGETERGGAPLKPAPAVAVFLDIPLGPEIGQCCGGRVRLEISRMDAALREQLVSETRSADAARPDVLLFGGGHVGHALAAAMALLPVRATVVETRAEALEGLPAGMEARLAALPEEAVRDARPGSAFVILTHDHALDFLLAAEALKRGDASYVGMIGSKTKRATFRRWFCNEAGGTEAQAARLRCPIGGAAVRDKRPAVIAALAAAEIVAALMGVEVARARIAAPMNR